MCLFALLMNEKEFSFSVLFNCLKNNYSFNPRNFITYFALEQIKANNIFPDCAIHSCFFHFSQAIQHSCKNNKITGKGTYKKYYELLFNIQIMCFIKKDKIKNFYKKIKKILKNKNTKNFFIFQ